MKVSFQYNKEKDIWCLLNKGKASNNSQKPTAPYQELLEKYGDNPSPESASLFIDEYAERKAISIQDSLETYQKEWDSVASQYNKKAEEIFKISLPKDIAGYITINSRCPYNIENDYFFVAVPTKSAVQTTMHELWHFYTWYGLGTDQQEKLGKEKYNDLKEAVTVILNTEYSDLLPEGISDAGYPQHQEIRKEILEFWNQEKDIFKLWEYFAKK